MKKPVVIFGIGKIAEVVAYVVENECDLEIAAFCVDREFCKEQFFLGKNVLAFEDIENHYSPEEYDFFVAIGYHNLNELRRQKCQEVKQKGYSLISIISKYANLPYNVSVGDNCFVMAPSMIHPCVTIANNVFVWSGALIGHHSYVGDNCWLTSNCNIGGNVKIGKSTFVALNATIVNDTTVGENCFIGANTQVVKPLLDGQVVISEASKPIKLNSAQFLKFSKQFSI